MKLKVRYKPAGYLRVLFFKGFLRFSINGKRLVCAHSKLTQALTQALTHTTPRNSYNSNYKPPSNPGSTQIYGTIKFIDTRTATRTAIVMET